MGAPDQAEILASGNQRSTLAYTPRLCIIGSLLSILVTMLGIVAEMERRFIRERQQPASRPQRKKGVYRGRKPTVPADRVRAIYADVPKPSAIAKEFGISRMRITTG